MPDRNTDAGQLHPDRKSRWSQLRVQPIAQHRRYSHSLRSGIIEPNASGVGAEGLVCATVAAQNYCVDAMQVGCLEDSPCLGDMGTCHENVCLPNQCGNGLVDTDEVCDDGNTIDDDDTCSATCQSTNACGNGAVDAIGGETCDSGVPGLSADGCASTCTLEALGWREITPRGPTTLTIGCGCSAVRDPLENRAICDADCN